MVSLTVECFYEMRKQLMTWMEHRLQISLKRYAILMED